MIPIKTLPDLLWTPEAAEEIARAPNLVEASDAAYNIDNLAIAGWKTEALTSPPWFWFALTVQFSVRDVRKLAALQSLIPAGAHTAVRAGFREGDRFAKFFHFAPNGETQDVDGIEYNIYVRP